MEYRKITSEHDWHDLWLTKFTTELVARNLSKEETSSYRSVLSDFLTAHKGNPREIGVRAMRAFLVKRKTAAIAPLALFYDCVAHSEKHLEQLALLSASSAKTAAKKP
jgi:hypothetical protein